MSAKRAVCVFWGVGGGVGLRTNAKADRGKDEESDTDIQRGVLKAMDEYKLNPVIRAYGYGG